MGQVAAAWLWDPGPRGLGAQGDSLVNRRTCAIAICGGLP